MEQRILQYRKQIDEWLTEMEQNVQTLSQHGEYSTQAVQRQTQRLTGGCCAGLFLYHGVDRA